MSPTGARIFWPIALVATFFLGWAAGDTLRTAPLPAPVDADVARLQQQVETLQARLRARDDVAAAARTGAAGERADGAQPRGSGREPRTEVTAVTPALDRTVTAPASRASGPAPTVQAALDRFYTYLEASNDTGGRERWRRAREMMDELRAMGPVAGQALMQVLAAGNDSDERRAAARLLGTLQVAQALPLLDDIVQHDSDLLLRRAAAIGLRQLQTPESLPVLERLVAQPAEDRFVRLSAAMGLAESGRPLGVTGLTSIFEESTADGRGRELAFRALARLQDDRPLPFMRQVAGSQAEPTYRLEAIRYLSGQGDQQALATLSVLMRAPNEQPSIRDAAAQAHAAISGRK